MPELLPVQPSVFIVSAQPISLWDSSAQEPEQTDSLEPSGHVDVLIVGGGFTGLSTALHCAEKGLHAQVIEAEQIGFGGSGRNCGLVNAALWLPPQKVRQQLGDTYGPRFVSEFSKGPEYVFSLIEKHQMRCEATRTGTLHAAHAASGYEELTQRAAEWARLGEPVELLDRSSITDLIGTDVFHGALLDHRAGTINPMGYCRGLARAARGAGAKISTGIRVTALHKDTGKWLVTTDQGSLTAGAVVLGTNAYTDDLWPDLKRNFTLINYFQLASKPLGPDAAHILPGRQGVWDTGRIMFNVRRDAYDRLLIGSMGKVVGSIDGGLSLRWARKQVKRLFPTLGDVEFEETWDGQIAMTPDHLPRIHMLDQNVYTAIGYNGRGITTGTLFGRSMAEILTGADVNSLPLPVTDTSVVNSAPVFSKLYLAAFTANQAVKSL
jgi:glycine/D-amino acid oxidase-like deaminating enzyme